MSAPCCGTVSRPCRPRRPKVSCVGGPAGVGKRPATRQEGCRQSGFTFNLLTNEESYETFQPVYSHSPSGMRSRHVGVDRHPADGRGTATVGFRGEEADRSPGTSGAGRSGRLFGSDFRRLRRRQAAYLHRRQQDEQHLRIRPRRPAPAHHRHQGLRRHRRDRVSWRRPLRRGRRAPGGNQHPHDRCRHGLDRQDEGRPGDQARAGRRLLVEPRRRKLGPGRNRLRPEGEPTLHCQGE